MGWHWKLHVVEASLVAFNDVIEKVTAMINLKKAVMKEDIQEVYSMTFSLGGNYQGNYNGLYTVEQSPRLIFSGDQEISFFVNMDKKNGELFLLTAYCTAGWFNIWLTRGASCAHWAYTTQSTMGWICLSALVGNVIT